MNKPNIEFENVINDFIVDLTRFTDDIKPDEEVIGYILVNVTKDKDINVTECCGGHPFVITHMCKHIVEHVRKHLEEQAND